MLVPAIFMLICLPGGLLVVQAGTGEAARHYELMYLSYSFPLLTALAAWWPTFMLKDRLESSGRELLYSAQSEKLWITPLLCTLLYWICMLPFILLAQRHQLVSLQQVIISFALALLVVSFGYVAAAITHSVIIGFIGGLLMNFGVVQIVNQFIIDVGSATYFFVCLAFLFLLSALCAFMGMWRLRHF